MKKKKTAFRGLAIALILCLISMLGASFVQTSGGKVIIKDLRWETPSGHLMSALLFIPENVSADTPAPGIVTSHGWYNTREMQDLNNIEYSRRGYVVLSIDMYGHGNSDAVSPEDWAKRGTGMYDAVELLADLPYVDKEKIGITGHSNGARAANLSILEDNKKDNPLISSVLLVANDAMYTNDPNEPLFWSIRTDEQEYGNLYGSRDVGIVAAQYDEFFFRSLKEDGTVTPPREYINTPDAQAFLNFGVDPKVSNEKRSSYEIYKQAIDGKETSRVIYNPAQTHPWNHFSKTVVTSSVEFFEDSLGAPNPITPTSQLWQVKVLFNFIGLIGFVMFIINITKVLLYTSPFASLRASKEAVAAPSPVGIGKAWFWGGLVVSALFSGVSYLGLSIVATLYKPSFLPQSQSYFIGLWSLVAGLFTILVLFVSYKFYSKKQGFNIRETGVVISFKTLLKTIGLALTVSFLAYSLVFIADYLFKTDFRIWVLTIKAFTPDKLLIALMYLPFFLVFYVANSVAINCFNFVKTGRKEWMNIALLAIFNSLAIIIIASAHYIQFFLAGEAFLSQISPILGIWIIPIVFILIVAAIISRKIYLVTKNPYLAGLINAIIVTIMTVTNTLTQL